MEQRSARGRVASKYGKKTVVRAKALSYIQAALQFSFGTAEIVDFFTGM